jgi:peptidoglycan/xylan/chitin deacetylase (PgdA/CDA1 family)
VRRGRLLGRLGKLQVIGSVTSVDTDQPVVAFTYDDGPDPEHTPAIMDVLARHGARATFFARGEQARRHPQLIRALTEAGHEVASHGDRHRDLTAVGPRVALSEIRRGQQEVARATGAPVHLFRPPYGRQTRCSRLLAGACGLQVVVWSANARDCDEQPIDQLVEQALTGLRPGGILLLHDGFAPPPEPRWAQTEPPRIDRAALTDRLLTEITALGWAVVPVGELMRCGRARLTRPWSARADAREDRRRAAAGRATSH